MGDQFTKDRFADLWDDWAEREYRLIWPTFLDEAERLGLAELVPVDDDALEGSFAEELGIEPGGMMWRLTASGHERYQACRAQDQTKGVDHG